MVHYSQVEAARAAAAHKLIAAHKWHGVCVDTGALIDSGPVGHIASVNEDATVAFRSVCSGGCRVWYYASAPDSETVLRRYVQCVGHGGESDEHTVPRPGWMKP